MQTRTNDYFITGTDTEIGKTFVTSALLRAFTQQGRSTLGMKPIASGAEEVDGVLHNEDVDSLVAASSIKAPQEIVVPYLMRTPAAPHIVAKLENVKMDVQHVQHCYQQAQSLADVVLVEGVGGFCVPLDDQTSTVDLAQRLGLPVILVVGMRLGCINHALLTAQAIRASGLKLAAWVANTVDSDMRFFDENVQAIAQRIGAPCLGVMPRLAADALDHAHQHLRLELLRGESS
ncbi:dethiobiotin synthase [Undibacterium cyanobacteriorum]|uniref:ATP-dependent dethiobiotin synthetase BioD n=1 Tax=Undibacterium cyanobacteriorum TaxID=3073561 RepID=A0ABY9RJE8_9BURK|nr:dethiobiotin synthase [Undibacterium sp. 20NA77.5]WMW80395.1 dethiobiotin synthase [Undibacterium sp. 20NA77.5]